MMSSRPLRPLPSSDADELKSDEQLMSAIAQGDAAAFEEVYDRLSPLLYPLCLRILQNPCDAQSVLLDVFWEVWRNRERFDPRRGSARTYLTTLARSRAIDHLRKKKRRTDIQQEVIAERQSDLIELENQQGPAQLAIDAEHGALVRQALDSLAHAQRESLRLAYFEGLTHQQIAEKTGTPLGSVKTYIRQGLIKLRSILRSHIAEGD